MGKGNRQTVASGSLIDDEQCHGLIPGGRREFKEAQQV
jgi:hypothetical protein